MIKSYFKITSFLLRMMLKFSIYVAGGIVAFTLNMFYFIAIVRTKTNRERYGLTGMEVQSFTVA